ncbi:hypothetical protein [Tenacibaculum soleae]|uniref:hypothetical protein n=1 Tax=Tenacibaculum soleae TaxID=447689 RepID=UPI002301D217|nr:hypothetical protein [Tenacibaculum soleae]
MKLRVSTNPFQEVFYSEKHQRFYFKRSANQIVHASAKPFMVGKQQRFKDFLLFLDGFLKNKKPFISKQFLDNKLDEFLGDCIKAEEMLVEAKVILGI